MLPSANFELKRIKAAKVVPKWPHLASCLPTVSVTVLIGITSSSYITKCSIIKKCYNYTWNAFLYIPSLFTRNPHKCSTVVLIPEPQITHGVGVLGTSWTLRQSTLIKWTAEGETTLDKNRYISETTIIVTFVETLVTLCRPLNISEFTQQDGRKRRTAKRLCVTNVTGLLLACSVVIFTK